MLQTPFLTTLYRLLLRLYPRPFRQEFAAEMQQVFVALVAETADQRGQPFLRLCLREFGGLLGSMAYEWITWIGGIVMQRWMRGFDWFAALAAWAGALLVLSALVSTFTVAPAGDGDLREASLEFALLMTPLLLGPLVLALARRGTHAANRVLVGSGLLGSLTVVIVLVVLLPLLGTAAYAAFPWLLLGVGVWLVGSNWPALWAAPLPQRVLAVCGVITGAGLCLLMGSIGLAPLLPSPANAPAWIVSLLNGMFIAIGMTFVVWAVGTGLRLVLPPCATKAR
jgi:hypothetical protein